MKPEPLRKRFTQFARNAASLLAVPRGRAAGAGRLRDALPAFRNAVRRDLENANRDLERTFLELGNQFLPLHGKVSDLAESCERLAALAGDQREGRTVFQEVVDELQQPLGYIDYCTGRQPELVALLQRCEDYAKEMLRVQKEMRDMLAPLTYIEVLFKIESAVLDQEHRDTFLTVATEIARLRGLVDETFAGNTRLLDSTHATLGTVRRRLAHDFEQHAAQVALQRRRIDTAIQALDSELTDSRRSEDELRNVSRQLAAHINTLVAGVQRQDIVKQKCDHVIDALQGFDPHALPAGPFLELQLRQLEAADHEIAEAAHASLTSVAAIERGAADVERHERALRHDPADTQERAGSAESLFAAHGGVHEIVRQTLALAETSLEAARPAEGIASNLSTSLDGLSLNMRLIALNAQVRSLQIGTGTGLEILAARTAALSGDIAGTSRRVAEELERLQQSAREMFAVFGDLIERGRTEISGLEARRGAGGGRLQQLRAETDSVVTEVHTTIDAVRASAQRAQETLAGVPVARAGISKAREKFAQLRARFQLQAVAQLDAADAAAFQASAGSYTMASERRVHEAVLHGQAAPARVEDAPREVELFDAPAPPASKPVPSKLASRPSPAAPATPADPVTPAKPAEDLGANVDLF